MSVQFLPGWSCDAHIVYIDKKEYSIYERSELSVIILDQWLFVGSLECFLSYSCLVSC